MPGPVALVEVGHPRHGLGTVRLALHERVELQGTADLMMSFCGGCAAFGSGFIKRAWGFHLLANGTSVAALALAVFAGTMVLSYREGAYSAR